jgi:hypothetical protein
MHIAICNPSGLYKTGGYSRATRLKPDRRTYTVRTGDNIPKLTKSGIDSAATSVITKTSFLVNRIHRIGTQNLRDTKSILEILVEYRT